MTREISNSRENQPRMQSATISTDADGAEAKKERAGSGALDTEIRVAALLCVSSSSGLTGLGCEKNVMEYCVGIYISIHLLHVHSSECVTPPINR